MSTPTENHGPITRAAARLRWAVFAAMTIMVLLYAAARFGVRLGAAHVEYRAHGGSNGPGRAIADAGMVLLVIALWRLTQMLGLIASGQLFSAAVIGRFRSFALWLLLMALLGLFAPMAAEMLAGLKADPHRFAFAIDYRAVLTVGITLLLFLLARLLERARGLDEEVREFV